MTKISSNPTKAVRTPENKRKPLKNQPNTKDQPDTKVLSVRIPANVYYALHYIAKHKNVTVTDLITKSLLHTIDDVLKKSAE
jgi:NRPS condensation-like uncharacterized protein